jgi:hypothetical protein
MASISYKDVKGNYRLGFPFIPNQKYDNKWYFSCVALSNDGRCTEYDSRPHGPCELYNPGADQMCALYCPVSEESYYHLLELNKPYT